MSAGRAPAVAEGPRDEEPAGRFRGASDVRLVASQVYFEQLNFWLNPVAAIFTLGFSVVFLVLLGASAGNGHSSVLGGIRVVQYYVPGFIAYGVMAACFNSLCISLVVRRETGLLKRARLAPLPTWVLLAAIFVSTLVICAIQVVILLAIGKLGYHVTLPTDWGAFVVALVVGAACFTALGAAMSTLIPNQDAAGPIVSVVFFVLLFLSGLWYPIDPKSGLAHFASFFPVRHMILAVFAPFHFAGSRSAWAWHDYVVMAVWGAAGVVVAARRWSWSPRRSDRLGQRPRLWSRTA
ncbi:MAG TPA: ABC transporter permease [Acidimicrobiales bacterium]|nr:ABC transporter permease [Acidimicrobiales bacterium]